MRMRKNTSLGSLLCSKAKSGLAGGPELTVQECACRGKTTGLRNLLPASLPLVAHCSQEVEASFAT